MTNLENYQLVHPELLTEETLIQVLKDRCIDASRLESSSKDELVEVFKRVALPLPQRRYNNGTHLGRKLISLRKSRGQGEAESLDIAPTSSNVQPSLQNNGSGCNQVGRMVDRLKPPLAGLGKESKKIRLSKPSTIPESPCDANKRRGEETLQESPGCKKRQKITWP